MGIAIAITLVVVTYFLAKPSKPQTTPKRGKRESVKFGEGLFQGSGTFDWWNFN